MSTISNPYRTMDDAALAGFRKIQLNYQDYQTYEYGFLVIESKRPIVRQLGHEGFMDTETQYHYIEPHTDHSTTSVAHDIPPGLARIARAFCHTHPKPGTFSSEDFRNFKKLRELKAGGKLDHEIIYYLMESSGQVRRSGSEEDFFVGEIIPGLSKAIP